MQALDIHGARSRNRTGTPLRAGDFKSARKFFKFKSLDKLIFLKGRRLRLDSINKIGQQKVIAEIKSGSLGQPHLQESTIANQEV